jgi:hypothetical protein
MGRQANGAKAEETLAEDFVPVLPKVRPSPSGTAPLSPFSGRPIRSVWPTGEEPMRAGLATVSVLAMLVAAPVPAFMQTALAQGGCTMAQLQGAYAVYGQGSGMLGNPPQQGIEVDVGIATLDGKGNLAGSITFSFNGKIFRTKFIGAYLVNSDCTITLSIQDDFGENLQEEGIVLDHGDEVRFIETNPGTVIARVAKRLN